ncbi:4-hydroxy-tetrahydrodipicolinate reductase [uncultured Sphaerochaeta sp.]|uniref:4-hydroxy-tetrahydrodipicolinate reductase n=1 Tax=uncultured Sphaerochaeta sp. TaxID=886478 RepID=UPI002A0A3C91|nr:4-hydroxy-tetrahydrodipicolinate reductase [uncultured Sphaerochaeta sp.]
MRIAIVGYGKMGKLIRTEALSCGHEVVAVIDPWSPAPEITALNLDAATLGGCDVAIDFTHPATIVDDIVLYARLGIPAVIGTTGWYDRLDEVKDTVEGLDCSIIYSGNYSMGVAVFLQIVKKAALLFDRVGGYDSFIQEIHHAQKADSPSGTASMLAQILLDNSSSKQSIVAETLHRKREDDEIQVGSIRSGYYPGTHTVCFDSPDDTIELTHRARSREGFAVGAVKAAQWIADGRKGFFTLSDMLDDVFKNMEDE